MNDDQELISRFRAGVRFIDGQRKLLIDTNASPDTVEALAGIVKHLHSLTESQVRRLLGGKKQKDQLRSRKAEEAAKVADMPLDAIQKLLDDEKTTRVQLENVAVGRFQVPRGSLRSFGNIDQLRAKVATLVRNEISHQTINKMARELKT